MVVSFAVSYCPGQKTKKPQAVCLRLSLLKNQISATQATRYKSNT